jgi:hypothetical protein
MRLLNVQRAPYVLEEFSRENIPRYIILSHTWDIEPNNEILFRDIVGTDYEAKNAWVSKVRGFVKVAQARGYRHVWIDTCCIDKSSSAELAEAINSMFEWYLRADACYVHLEDEPGSGPANLGSMKPAHLTRKCR